MIWKNGAKQAYAVTGGHKAGVLKVFVCGWVKSVVGEQTILCGLLQTGSIYVLTKW
jgi:ketol-acid reductoisomerase